MKTVLYVVTAVSVANSAVRMGINRIVQLIPRLVRQSITEALPLFYPPCRGRLPLRESLSEFFTVISRRQRYEQ